MSFGAIRARISEEMRRGEFSTSSTVIAKAVEAAISYFKRRRFYFNEFEDTTFTHSSSTTFHTLSADVIKIDSAKAVLGTRDWPLTQLTWKEIDEIDANQHRGFPSFYTIHGNLFRLYPVPNQDTVIRISGIGELPTVSASATWNTTNAWVEDEHGEPMIRAKAKAYLFRDILRNITQAAVFDQQAELEAREIQRETRAKAGTGRVRQPGW